MDGLNIDSLQQIIVNSLSELGVRVAGFIPNFIGMLIILLVGWVIARVVSSIAKGGLARAGLDRASTRLGLTETLREAGMEQPPSGIIGRLLFWLLMLTFVLSAVETLGLSAVTETIDRLIAYLPNIIAAALIIVLGLLLARFVGNLVGSGASAAEMPYARQLGSAARSVMVIMVSILAIGQLGVDAAILLWAAITILAATALGLGLAFALGSREVIGAILSGHYLRKSLPEGASVTVNGRTGVLQYVGPVETVLRSSDGAILSVPNAFLMTSEMERR